MIAVQTERKGGVSLPAGSDVVTRLVSAAVLAILPLLGAWFGGWLAGLVVAAAAAIVHIEWTGVTRDADPYRHVWTAGLVVSLLALTAGYSTVAVILLVATAVSAAVVARAAWPPAGVVYAALFGFGLLLVRLSPDDGRAAIFFLLAVVWGTDTGAFFVGRAVGGARLWPAVSPKKTWSGAIGGFVAGIIAGPLVAALLGVPPTWQLVLVAAVLALSAEAGDLFESWVKRRFGAKDASRLVPGHGGLMDRVDGLVFAVAVAVVIAWVHGGAANIATGLIRW